MCDPRPTNTHRVFAAIGPILSPDGLSTVAPTSNAPLTETLKVLHSPDYQLEPDLHTALHAAATCMAMTYWREHNLFLKNCANSMVRIVNNAHQRLYGTPLQDPERLARQLGPLAVSRSLSDEACNDLAQSVLFLLERALDRYDMPISGFPDDYLIAARLERKDTNSGRIAALETLFKSGRPWMSNVGVPVVQQKALFNFIRRGAWPLLTGVELV